MARLNLNLFIKFLMLNDIEEEKTSFKRFKKR